MMTMHSSTFYCLLPPRRPIRATKKTTSFKTPLFARFLRTEEEEEEERPTQPTRERSGTLAKNGGRFSKLIMSKSFFGRRKKLSCCTTSTSLSPSISLCLSIYLSIYLSICLSISKPETAPTRFASPRTNRSLGRTVVPRVRAKIEARVRSRRLRFVPRRVRALLESR